MRTSTDHIDMMRQALALAQRAYGDTSPNPLVGAILVKNGRVIGKGWHQRAGQAHAEIAAIEDAKRKRENPAGATLYVTLEPCSTFGRTPPCTEKIIAAQIKRVVVGATDPNPKHAGAGFKLLRRAGIQVVTGVLAAEAERLNEGFNHWIVHRRPFVTIKAAMTLDGKIATRTGDSKWITDKSARDFAMWLRRGADALLVGVNTVIRDDPALTLRPGQRVKDVPESKTLRRIILDPQARTPRQAQVLSDSLREPTTIVVSERASAQRVRFLEKSVRVLHAPEANGTLDLNWVLDRLGQEEVVSLLVEGGGETNAGFLSASLVQRIYFFYAPKIVQGRASPKAVGGVSLALDQREIRLRNAQWEQIGPDILLTGRTEFPPPGSPPTA